MCGLIGIVTISNSHVEVSDSAFSRMRDTMIARGPDASGMLRRDNALLGHRRLSIVDIEHGHQPMLSRCGRYAVVYNGELYNDSELRADLPEIPWRTNCDTETVLEVLARRGAEGLATLRGMFGLAFYDFQEGRLLLARDPLGIKPLYFARIGNELVFGSHIPAVLAHPRASINPDWATVSAYLTTLRSRLGNRTLFEGVQALRPGEYLEVATAKELTLESGVFWQEPEVREWGHEEAVDAVRKAVSDSVQAHLRADVSRCSLLSGGLDSSIIATLAAEHSNNAEDLMRTWCAGGPSPNREKHDFGHAALVASHLGTAHTEVELTGKTFQQYWSHLVDEVGLPVSTPNETAIYAVCRDLKPKATVALSGEGADELFAGYEPPLLAGLDGIQQRYSSVTSESPWWQRYLDDLTRVYGTHDLGDEVQSYLMCTSWAALSVKPHLLRPEVMEAAGNDGLLLEELYSQFLVGPDDPKERLLRVYRRINLTGLLRRLDTASMTASVEGRTPFADIRVAELAMSMPFDLKLYVPRHSDGGFLAADEAGAHKDCVSKRVLREGFSDRLPSKIVNRPKASFPLPFQAWLRDSNELLMREPLKQVIRQDALDFLAADPEAHWQMAWPVMNLSRWLTRWWG